MTSFPVPASRPVFNRRARLVRVPGLSLPYQLRISRTRGVMTFLAPFLGCKLLVTWNLNGSGGSRSSLRTPYSARQIGEQADAEEGGFGQMQPFDQAETERIVGDVPGAGSKLHDVSASIQCKRLPLRRQKIGHEQIGPEGIIEQQVGSQRHVTYRQRRAEVGAVVGADQRDRQVKSRAEQEL